MNALMSRDEQKELAQKHGWNPLGEISVDVKTDLTDKDRIDLGMESARDLNNIRKLEKEKKDFDDKIKGQINGLNVDNHARAHILERGYKLENKTLPCFYDPMTNNRLFVDPKSGEIVTQEEAHEDDSQAKLF